MEVSVKFKEWYESQSRSEQTESIKKHAIRLASLKKAQDKAVASEIAYGFNRIGKRGGKFTSLNAKADNCARMFDAFQIELKYMINTL